MRTSVRLWRTEAGALVNEGHRDAVTLAYGENDDVENEDQAEAAKLQPKGKAAAVDEHTPKAEAKPAPKQRPRKSTAAKQG